MTLAEGNYLRFGIGGGPVIRSAGATGTIRQGFAHCRKRAVFEFVKSASAHLKLRRYILHRRPAQ
jgi:hypothetical protein